MNGAAHQKVRTSDEPQIFLCMDTVVRSTGIILLIFAAQILPCTENHPIIKIVGHVGASSSRMPETHQY